MKKTVSDFLIDTLIKNKIDTIFGIIGAGNAEIFSSIQKRKEIILNLRMIDDVIDFKDDTNGTCINALIKIKEKFMAN